MQERFWIDALEIEALTNDALLPLITAANEVFDALVEYNRLHEYETDDCP